MSHHWLGGRAETCENSAVPGVRLHNNAVGFYVQCKCYRYRRNYAVRVGAWTDAEADAEADALAHLHEAHPEWIADPHLAEPALVTIDGQRWLLDAYARNEGYLWPWASTQTLAADMTGVTFSMLDDTPHYGGTIAERAAFRERFNPLVVVIGRTGMFDKPFLKRQLRKRGLVRHGEKVKMIMTPVASTRRYWSPGSQNKQTVTVEF